MRHFIVLCLWLIAALPAGAQTVLAVVNGPFTGFAIHRLDIETGVLTELAVPMELNYVIGIAQLPDGRVVASLRSLQDGLNRLVEIDPQTGELVEVIGVLTQAGGGEPFVGDLAVDPSSGELYGIEPPLFLRSNLLGGNGANSLYRINTETAECTVLGMPDLDPVETLSLGFTSDGTLWSTSGPSPNLLTLDKTNAAVLTTQTIHPAVGGWAIDNLGDDTFLMSESVEGGAYRFFRLDPATGTATFLSQSNLPIDYVEDFAVVFDRSVVDVPALEPKWLIFFVLALGAAGLGLLARR